MSVWCGLPGARVTRSTGTRAGYIGSPKRFTTIKSSLATSSRGPPRSGITETFFPLTAAVTRKNPDALPFRLATRAPGLTASSGNCTTSGKCSSNTSPNFFRALSLLTSPAIRFRREGSAMSLIRSSSRAIAHTLSPSRIPPISFYSGSYRTDSTVEPGKSSLEVLAEKMDKNRRDSPDCKESTNRAHLLGRRLPRLLNDRIN